MRSALLLICCVPLLAATPVRESIDIPDLPSADMRISWQDFKELLERIQPPVVEEEPEAKRPPLPFSVQAVSYRIDATDMEAVRVEATMQIFVWDDEEWWAVTVLRADSALDAITHNGEPTFLTQQGEDLVILLEEPGAHRLEFVFFVRPTVREGIVSLRVPAQPAPSTRAVLRLAEPEAIVSAPKAASVRTRVVEDELEALLSFPSSDSLEINWRLPAKPAPEEPEKPREPARIGCATTTIATVSDNFVSLSSYLHFDVLRGETQSFTMRLPAGVQVLAVEGKGVSWETTEDGGGQALEAAVNHAISTHYTLEVRYEMPIPAAAATIELPRLTVDGMVRQRGFIAVATDGNVEIEAGNDTANPKRVDVSDLPAELIARSRNPVLHAFRYNDPEFLLPLDFRRLEDVPVRVATIDRARITSVVTPDGMIVHRAHYTVRNHHKKFLRVAIGPEAEVWTAHVAGELVRPARDGAEDGAVLLPLRRSAPQAGGQGAFGVELTWMQPAPPMTGWRSRAELAAPGTDLMANEVKWEVYLPEDRVVYRSAGDIAALDALAEAPVMIQLARDAFARTEPKRVPRIREGIERFFITDINGPAGSAMAQSRTFEDALDTASQRPRPEAQVAGVIPVDIPLPQVGRPHYFERTIVREGAELSLVIDMYHARLRGMARALAVAAAFFAGLILARLIGARADEPLVQGLALAALGLAALLAPAVAGAAAAPYIRWACAGAALALAPRLAKAWRNRVQPA